MKSYRGKTRQAYMYSCCPGRVSKRVPLLTKSVTARADAVCDVAVELRGEFTVHTGIVWSHWDRDVQIPGARSRQ